jgi:FlaA1/EpsC-like NDP-sugar epimerase
MLDSLKSKVQYLIKPQILGLILLDAILLPSALFSTVWLRLGGDWDPRLDAYLWLFWTLPLWTIPVFIISGLYRAITKYLDYKCIYTIFIGVTISVAMLTLLIYFNELIAFPRSTIVIFWLFGLAYIGGSRFILRELFRKLDNQNAQNLGIYGAGSAGVELSNSLAHNPEFQAAAFFDDDPQKWNTSLKGIRVYPPHDLLKVVQQLKIKKVLLAMPSTTLSRKRKIIDLLEQHSIPVQILPGVADVINQQVKFSDVRDINIEDLLGREAVPVSVDKLNEHIEAKHILITGAGGSIGSELARQVAKLNPAQLVLLDSSEFALYSIEQELREKFPQLKISMILGSITNMALINQTLQDYPITTIYHAAAYKHVPMVEYNPLSGLENNALGTLIVAQAAATYKVEHMVLISTDKAVRPTNIMGASKRLAELILQAMSTVSSQTIFSMVRFGNVLGSSGSVVPLFKRQIAKLGPVTITHPDIIRYFMTIPEAVELVIQASSLARGGEVFVLDMGEPVKIVDLARKMIYLSGYSVKDENHPEGDIEIQYTGLRPGEKLYEELLIGNNPSATEHPRIMKANENYIEYNVLIAKLTMLAEQIKQLDMSKAIYLLHDLVPEYSLANFKLQLK